jgi:uncharacterized membrane protein YhaH (DUF805 family)
VELEQSIAEGVASVKGQLTRQDYWWDTIRFINHFNQIATVLLVMVVH